MTAKRLLITGATGFVGKAVQSVLKHRLSDIQLIWSDLVLMSSTKAQSNVSEPFRLIQTDLADAKAWRQQLDRLRQDAELHILHLAALAEPAACQRDPDRSFQLNVQAVQVLADWANRHSSPLIFTSSEQVFDGHQFLHADKVYGVGDSPNPLNIYGEHKLAAEKSLASNADLFKIIRLPLMYSLRENEGGFLTSLRNTLACGQSVTAFTDEIRPPALVDDIATALVNALSLQAAGKDLPPIMHLGGPQAWSRYDIALAMANAMNIPSSRVIPQRQRDLELGRFRPGRLVLDSACDWRLLGVNPLSLSDAFLEELTSGIKVNSIGK